MFACALGEPKREYRLVTLPEQNQRPVATRLALPSARNPLLDDTAAKIGIHQTAFCALHGFTKRGIGNPLFSREALEPTIFEDARYGGSPASVAVYNT